MAEHHFGVLLFDEYLVHLLHLLTNGIIEDNELSPVIFLLVFIKYFDNFMID